MTEASAGGNEPRWDGQAPFYEDWYVKANLPEEDASLWFRYTMRAPPDQPAEASVWAIVEVGGASTAAKRTVEADQLSLQADPFTFETPHGRLTERGCQGEVGPVRFDLAWEPSPYAFQALPGWAYRLPGRLSKTVTPNPDLSVTGRVEVDGREFDVSSAPGQQGHVWGQSHADAWAWAHDNAGPGPTVEVAATRRSLPGLGSVTMATALVRHEGRTLAFHNPMANRAAFDGDGLRLQARTLRHRLTIEVDADRLRRVLYTDPDGTQAFCHNTKRGEAELQLFERSLTGERRLGSWFRAGTTAFEVGLREPIDGTEALLDGADG